VQEFAGARVWRAGVRWKGNRQRIGAGIDDGARYGYQPVMEGSFTSNGSSVTARTAATVLAAAVKSSPKVISSPAIPSTPSSAAATSL
jgi:hypothetical protein